ncbi:MAG: hypothetical protein IKJ73_00880 [Lachnospiraceae bacterium]|nr:hypothetical protein [Lachnospiraceae bacterium]
MIQEYTRENIKETVYVPASVEAELKTNIENQLNKCGIFYRVFSRRKSATSLEHKLATGKYGGADNKKIQDLIGLRVNLYFQDDLDICKELFQDMFEMAEKEWSENEMRNENFEASKINGVFKLPGYMVSKISPETWELPIDQTFEIQLKTVFFEGWHEVEHDFRYKMKDKTGEKETSIWDNYSEYSRQFNSVVATLELCDRSMVVMFEDFAHKLYKEHNWDMMLRMHYRVRISDQPLYDGLAEILDDEELKLGKKLFKTNRNILIEKLKNFHRDIPISVNMIIALLNDKELGNNEQINNIMRANNVYKDGISITDKSYSVRELAPMTPYCVFKNKVLIRYGKEDIYGAADAFRELPAYIYKWMRAKFRPVFQDIPEEFCDYENMSPGYQISFKASPNEFTLNMSIMHLAQDVGARMWGTEVEIKPHQDDIGVWMEIKNIMYDGRTISEAEQISRFSYPTLYRTIFSDSRLSVVDAQKYWDKVFVVCNEDNVKSLSELIQSEERLTPVVVLASNMKEDGSGYLDEEWIGKYWSINLHKQVRYYAHVYRCSVDDLPLIKEDSSRLEDKQLGVYVFWPKCYSEFKPPYEFYSQEDIGNCVYNRLRGEGAGVREDRIKDGATAFSVMLVDEIKKCIIKSH